MVKELIKIDYYFLSIDTDIINNRYDIVEILINEELYDKIKLNFNRINDYEKSIRNMGLQLLTPILFYSDYLTYEYLLNNIDLVQSNDKLNCKYQIIMIFFLNLKNIIMKYQIHLSFKILQLYLIIVIFKNQYSKKNYSLI